MADSKNFKNDKEVDQMYLKKNQGKKPYQNVRGPGYDDEFEICYTCKYQDNFRRMEHFAVEKVVSDSEEDKKRNDHVRADTSGGTRYNKRLYMCIWCVQKREGFETEKEAIDYIYKGKQTNNRFRAKIYKAEIPVME